VLIHILTYGVAFLTGALAASLYYRARIRGVMRELQESARRLERAIDKTKRE
jgi:hypothetical protein